MTTTTNAHSRTYNPGFLSDEELIGSFVVRQSVFSELTAQLRAEPKHVLVEGPRGIGKTTLLLRVAAELRRDANLRSRFVPLVLSEEVYEAGTVAEFFLECVFHLAQSTGDARLTAKYDELKSERVEDELLAGAIAALTTALRPGQRLVIFAENLHMLLTEQLGPGETSKLDRILAKQDSFILFATTVSQFEDRKKQSRRTLQFRHFRLDPLSDDDCRTLIKARSNRLLEGEKVRPIQILTGGNPRLITILSGFAASKSLRELMDELSSLIDEHTAYFKTNIESLPFRERKVLVSLADLWAPATAASVAGTARMDINTTSAYLARLERRGLVAVVDSGRTKTYQVAERLYNIYHLMRRSGRPSNRIRAVVDFMVSFYAEEQDDLVSATTSIASEACRVAPSEREAHFAAYETLVTRFTTPGARAQIIEKTEPEFFRLPDFPQHLRKSLSELPAASRTLLPHRRKRATESDLRKIDKLIDDGQHEVAEGTLRQWLAAAPDDARVATRLAVILHQNRGKFDEAIELYKSLVARQGYIPGLSWLLADALMHRSRHDEAMAVLQASLERHPEDGANWALLGHVLHFHCDRSGEARRAYKKAIKYNATDPELLREYATLLTDIKQVDEAKATLELALEHKRESLTLLQLARLRARTGDAEGAEQAFQEAIASSPSATSPITAFANFLTTTGRVAEAERYLRAELQKRQDSPRLWHALGHALEARADSAAALAAFQQATALDAADSGAWIHIGLLHASQGDVASAGEAFQNAITADPNNERAVVAYIKHLRATSRRKLFAALKEMLDGVTLGEQAWVSLMWSMMGEYPMNTRMLRQWTNQMLHAPDGEAAAGFVVFTAAVALALTGEWVQAIDTSQRFIAEATSKRAQADVIDFFIAATAAGYAHDVKRALSSGPWLQTYEPLAIAVDREIGLKTVAPQEILKIADDVTKRVRLATQKGSEKYLRQRLGPRYRQ